MFRDKNNPIIERSDVPNITDELTDVSAVFNPGAVLFDKNILLLLSVETRGGKTYLVKAVSDDGIRFAIDNDFFLFILPDGISGEIYHISDPRITFIENKYFIVCTVTAENGTKLWITTTTDFEEFEEIGFALDISAHNGVLLPEKIDGKFTMFFTPVMNIDEENGIFMSQSEDLLFWDETKLIAEGNPNYWDEIIYPGPPPIKTKKGWLQIYGAVKTQNRNYDIYQAGALLLDLAKPSKVLARTKMNIMEPRENYELIGRSPGVILPSGIIVKEKDDNGFAKDNSEILIYYGSAKTSVSLYHATLEEILQSLYFNSD